MKLLLLGSKWLLELPMLAQEPVEGGNSEGVKMLKTNKIQNKANRLHEQLAGHKSRLKAEVELLKAEAAKVVEMQQALVEADQQRGQLADDKGRLQAEVDRPRGQVTTGEGG